MQKFIIILFVYLFLMLASGGGMTKADYTPVPTDTDTMECFNYEIVSNQMFDLQSRLIHAKGRRTKANLEKKINQLRPSVINREVQCLGYGVTPN